MGSEHIPGHEAGVPGDPHHPVATVGHGQAVAQAEPVPAGQDPVDGDLVVGGWARPRASAHAPPGWPGVEPTRTAAALASCRSRMANSPHAGRPNPPRGLPGRSPGCWWTARCPRRTGRGCRVGGPTAPRRWRSRTGPTGPGYPPRGRRAAGPASAPGRSRQPRPPAGAARPAGCGGPAGHGARHTSDPGRTRWARVGAVRSPAPAVPPGVSCRSRGRNRGVAAA